MKLLGLDIGSKRIGAAVSDELCITAQGLGVIESENEQKALKRLSEIVKQEKIEEIVVGLPLNMNGSKGPQAEKAIKFCDTLKKELNLPVKLWDERMSTMEADKVLIRADVSRAKRRKKIDKLAAQIILQSYLDSIKKDV